MENILFLCEKRKNMETKMKINQKSSVWFKWITASVVMLGMCILHACSSVDDESMRQKSRVRINVSPFQLEIEDMGVTSRTAIADAATRLSFAVFDAQGTLVGTAISQQSSDTSFGTIDMELYPGSYQMVAVAHNGDADAVINSTTSVTLPGTTFTDTFAEVQSLTVEANKDCNFTMTLPRATSAFILKLKDTPPANAKEIKVVVNSTTYEPTTLKINPSTRLAENTWKQTCIIPIADIAKEIPIYYIGMYSVTAVTVKATAYDTDGNEIISHTISNVPLNPNQKTIASGYFFQSPGSGTFTLEAGWGTDKEMDY